MTRITLTIAAAVMAASTMFTSSAEACISCEYVPEVLKAGQSKSRKQQVYASKPTPKKRVAKAVPVRKAPKKIDIAKAPAPKKVIQTAKAPEQAKPVETAKTETPATETAKTEETATAPETTSEPREKPISTAALLEGRGNAASEEKPAATDEGATGCKKFFPAVGMTLTVPCE